MSIDDIEALDDTTRRALKQLRLTSPDENLDARLEIFTLLSPQFVKQRFGMVPTILEQGFATIGVDEGLVYTLGIHYRYELPEIMIVDERMPDVVLANAVNRIARRMLYGAPPIPGETIEDLIGPLTFYGYTKKMFEKYPCGYLYSFYRFFADEVVDDVDPPVLIAIADRSRSG